MYDFFVTTFHVWREHVNLQFLGFVRTLGEREIPTSRVGDLVMRELAKLDKIAYIRFASVYRSFESPDDFREAVQEVKTKKGRRGG